MHKSERERRKSEKVGERVKEESVREGEKWETEKEWEDCELADKRTQWMREIRKE